MAKWMIILNQNTASTMLRNFAQIILKTLEIYLKKRHLNT